jgi:hypothetical protein
MRSTTRMAVVLALGWMAYGANDASAAWDNVFQTTCCGGNSTRSSYFAPSPAPACCPSVSYVQRCYYQPVTTYKTESYYEPVTSYRTSYYWQPTTSYRYTSYYDPCTGCCRNVATAHTSYSLRSQCNAVQSYVQRCRMVPVTEMRTSYYMEPVVTNSSPCCENSCPQACASGCPTTGCPNNCPNTGAADAGRTAPPNAGVQESNEPARIPSANIPNPSSYKKNTVQKPQIDRVASYNNRGRLQGVIVNDDRISPLSNAKLSFVEEGKGSEIIAKADYSGRFSVELPAGEYTLYIPGNKGQQVFHSTLLVKNTDNRVVTVVSR